MYQLCVIAPLIVCHASPRLSGGMKVSETRGKRADSQHGRTWTGARLHRSLPRTQPEELEQHQHIDREQQNNDAAE